MNRCTETTLPDGSPVRLFPSGAIRGSSKGRGRFDLVARDFARANRALAIHMERGAAKFGDANWTKGMPESALLESQDRHKNEYCIGDTSEDHLVSMVANALIWLETRERVKAGVLPESLLDVFPLRVKPPEPAPVVESAGTFGDWGKASGCAPKSYPVAGFLTGSGIEWTNDVP